MIKRTSVTASILAIALVGLAAPAWSQQQQATPPKEPRPIEAGPEAAQPLKVRVPDPDELMRRLQQLHQQQNEAAGSAGKGPAGDPEKDAAADDGAGFRRVIEVDPQQAVNFFPVFLFNDATPRDGEAERLPQLTLQQRRAAVENYRRSVAKKKQGN